MRAASSAWMVGGISSVGELDRGGPAVALAPERAVVHEHAHQLAEEERVALAGREHAARDGGRQRVGADHARGEPRRRAGVEAAERHHVGDAARPATPARSARRAARGAPPRGRAAARRRPTARGARSRSSSSGSAHCRSSIASTTGCAAASAASRRRTTKKVSSGDAGVPARSAAMPAAMRALGLVAGRRGFDRRAQRVAAGAVVERRCARSASASGAKVAPPAASHCGGEHASRARRAGARARRAGATCRGPASRAPRRGARAGAATAAS